MSIVSKTTKRISGFDPRTIPGCTLWLDAADRNTLTLSGNNVTQWRDKSGNGKNATTSTNYPTVSSNSLNGLSTIRFSGASGTANFLDIPAFDFGTATRTAIFVIQNTGPSSGTASAPHWFWPNTGNGTNSLSLVGWIGAAVQGQSGEISVTASLNTYLIVVFRFGVTTGFQELFINGTRVGTKTKSMGGTSYANATSGYRLGWLNNNDPNTNLYFDGNMAEVILTNTAITDAQRQQLEGYLANKWGLRGNIPATHPFKSYPVFTRPFQPVDISSCSLWLDSLDVCGNGINPVPGTAISVWADKSGNGYNLSQTVASNQPIFTASGVSFDGTSSFMTRTNPNIRPAIFYTVVQANTLSGIRHILRLGTSGGTNAEYYLRQSNADIATAYFNTAGTGVAVGIGGGATTDLQLISSTWNGSTIYFYKNGGLSNSGSLSGTQFVASNATIFGLGTQSNTATNVWSGTINEVIFYDSYPSDAERQQVEGYLANKWGLRGNLPATHAFKLYNALSPMFTPVQVSGCVMWLDAADATNMTLSGTNVTTWTDKSGNGNNATTGGVTPPAITKAGINGLDVLEFGVGNTEMVSQDLYGNRSFAMFAITRRKASYTAGTVTAWLAGLDQATNSNCIFGYSGNSTVKFGFYNNELNVTIATYAGASEPPYVLGFYYTPGTRQVWANGSLLGSDTNSTNLISASRMRIGRFLSAYWRGQIGEIIAYNGVLNPSHREAIEGYLAHKWGLEGSLPASHPYRKIRP